QYLTTQLIVVDPMDAFMSGSGVVGGWYDGFLYTLADNKSVTVLVKSKFLQNFVRARSRDDEPFTYVGKIRDLELYRGRSESGFTIFHVDYKKVKNKILFASEVLVGAIISFMVFGGSMVITESKEPDTTGVGAHDNPEAELTVLLLRLNEYRNKESKNRIMGLVGLLLIVIGMVLVFYRPLIGIIMFITGVVRCFKSLKNSNIGFIKKITSFFCMNTIQTAKANDLEKIKMLEKIIEKKRDVEELNQQIFRY
ncbi:MAG: hypothetical protein K6F84_08850, partial [Lachnospiraceae bacterium]|nr:hypothetical protein [Lachnospiraceae bacterium]